MYTLSDGQTLHFLTCVGPEWKPTHATRLHLWADQNHISLTILGVNDVRISHTGWYSGYRLLLLQEYIKDKSRAIPDRCETIRASQKPPLPFEQERRNKHNPPSPSSPSSSSSLSSGDVILFVDNPQNLLFNSVSSMDEIYEKYIKNFDEPKGEEVLFAGRYELEPPLKGHTEFFAGTTLQRRLAFPHSGCWMGRVKGIQECLSRIPFTYKTDDKVWWTMQFLCQTNSFFGTFDGTHNSPCLNPNWCRSQRNLQEYPSPRSERSVSPGSSEWVALNTGGEEQEERKERTSTTVHKEFLGIDHSGIVFAAIGAEEPQTTAPNSAWNWSRGWSLRLATPVAGTSEIFLRPFLESDRPVVPRLLYLSRANDKIRAQFTLPLMTRDDLGDPADEWPSWGWIVAIILGVMTVTFVVAFSIYCAWYNARPSVAVAVK